MQGSLQNVLLDTVARTLGHWALDNRNGEGQGIMLKKNYLTDL